MKKNVRIAKELVKLAKMMVADDESYRNDFDSLKDSIERYIKDYVGDNFGIVDDGEYEVTFDVDNWQFVIECGDNSIDEETVRRLIRTGEANRKFNKVLGDAQVKSMWRYSDELYNLAQEDDDFTEEERESENFEGDATEFDAIMDCMDFLPSQEVVIKKNGVKTGTIPWTQNMWGGGAWG